VRRLCELRDGRARRCYGQNQRDETNSGAKSGEGTVGKLVYSDEARTSERCRFHMLRQQWERKGQDAFWIHEGRPAGRAHIAFEATSREQVDGFYAAAIEAGARDNGAPGLRTEYSATYYAGYVLDPNGNNIEAVFHGDAPNEKGLRVAR